VHGDIIEKRVETYGAQFFTRSGLLKYITHKAGGTLGMLIAFGILKKHGMLVPNVNPYIQLLIMYPAASWGSTMPDLDTSKSSVSEHTPLSMATNLFLRMLGAKA
jgi:hypothetical protein